jgi:predicted dehydrogenase
VATPDHNHAVISMAAMKRGKHVFCQKPLTYTVHEAQLLAKTAKKYNVVTQMGNQGHAKEGARLTNEWLWDGAIGDVQEVHCWTDRPAGWWPQGVECPTEIATVPSTLDWDLWLGPAPFRPYHPAYVPFKWRGWKDFGVGALGDMGAHIIDHPFWALDLGYPETVEATSTKLFKDTYPLASIVRYHFPAKGKRPSVKLVWYDGGLKPPRPPEFEPGRQLGKNGVLYIGTKGVMIHGSHGAPPRLVPETKMKEYHRPDKTIPRSPGIHEEWIEAIQKNQKSSTDFRYSGLLTEVMLLGNIAILMNDKNVRLQWDPNAKRFSNLSEANELLHREYRQGWSLE